MVVSRTATADYLAEVEWPTLIFFMGLFVIVGALVNVGVIDAVGEAAIGAVGDDYLLAATGLLFGSAVLSATTLKVALVAAGTAAVILLLLGLPPWLVDQAHGRLADTDRVRAITEERRTVLAVFAAVGAAITLWYTHQRQEPDRDANRTDRYTKQKRKKKKKKKRKKRKRKNGKVGKKEGKALSNSATRPNPPSNWAACTP